MVTNITAGSKLGQYEILGELGRGGAGSVYHARDAESGEEVALKTLMPGTVINEEIHKRFVREISVAQKLSHDNIVSYHDCGLHDDILYYTMDLVAWGSLADTLSRTGHLPWREAAECGIHICEGLGHLHSQSVVHRDLKPANIFLSDDGRLKVGDFGLARDLNSDRLTIDGQTVGTAKYLAPEQARAQADIDGRTDLYALGCLMFEMVSGRTPFVSEQQYATSNYMELMQKHVEESAPSLSEFVPSCPAPLAALVDRLLAKNRDDRPSSAAEVATTLRTILDDPSIASSPSGDGESDEALEAPKSLTERLVTTEGQERKMNTTALVAIFAIVVIGLVIAIVMGGS